MNKKLLISILVIILVFLLVLCCLFVVKFRQNKENMLTEKFCSENPNGNECFSFRYRKLIPHFIVYDAFVDKKPLKFLKLGSIESTVYIVPYYALQKSEALMGYGILDEMTFEEQYSTMFKKPSYGFDCGTPSMVTRNKQCHFESECIGTDEFILPGMTSSEKIHTYSQKIKDLNLENKPVFLRIDIAGAEPYVIDDILKHSKNITGIALVTHSDNPSQIPLAVELLKKIEKDFVLVLRQTHSLDMRINPIHMTLPGTKKTFGRAMSLTYVNKNIIDDYRLRLNQDSASFEWDGHRSYIYDSDILLYYCIPYLLKNKFNTEGNK